MYTHADHLIAKLSFDQHGPFLRRQALDAGLTERQIDYRLDHGVYGTLADGLYHPAAFPLTPRSRLMGACLLDPRVRAAREAAAELLDFHPLVPRGRIVVKGPIGRTGTHPLAEVHRSKLEMPDQVVVVDGIPCTSIVETVGDLSAVLRSGAFVAVVEDLLNRKLMTPDQLNNHAVRWCRRGRKGSRQLWRTAEAKGNTFWVPETKLERLGRKVLAEGGLPTPVREMQLPWRDDIPGRVDLAWPQCKVIVELDSWRYHGPDVFEKDRERDIEANAIGWRTIRITWKMLTERPDWVVRRVGEILANCGA